MAKVNILKTDSRGRITLPPPFRAEPLFEYVIEDEQITLYPIRTVRKFPDMSGIPEEGLPSDWMKDEERLNRDRRPPIAAKNPSDALKDFEK